MFKAKRVLRRLRLYTACHECDICLLNMFVKVRWRLRLIDKIEEIGHDGRCQQWMVIRWGIWLTKFDNRTFSILYELYYLLNVFDLYIYNK